ncbi:hypothetical protein DPSP01_013141 [Paraphaeosphaeria sporulosa]
MVVLSSLQHFPSFADVRSGLTHKTRQCIWYLPGKQRYCMVRTEASKIDLILELTSQLDDRKSCTLRILSEIAELSCCALHHRNRIWATGLAKSLAHQWQQGLQSDLSETAFESAGAVKVECEHSPRCDTAEGNEETEKKLELVAFSPHIPFEGDTLRSTLLSQIESTASKIGSVYAFTYLDSAFDGMIKIGYTSRSIDLRMDEWADCGHGPPHLLKSFSNDWHAMRWCKYHERSHIEWFKTSVSAVSQVVQAWISWIERANPYDRRGNLKPFWRGIIDFLSEYEITITAELMVQIQEIEDGTVSVASFIDDELLRKERLDLERVCVKQEEN